MIRLEIPLIQRANPGRRNGHGQMLSFAMRISRPYIPAVLAGVFALALAHPAAQDRLRTMPGYDQFTQMNKQLQGGAFVSGAVTVRWEETGRGFTYTLAGQPYRFDVATLTATPEPVPPAPEAGAGFGPADRE